MQFKIEKDAGGYAEEDLQEAREALDGGKMEAPPKEVKPMYIKVIPEGRIVRTEEMGDRVVMIDYDEFGNIVGVELL